MTDWPAGSFMSMLGPRSANRLLTLSPPRHVPANRVLIAQGDAEEQVMLLCPPEDGTPADPACVKVTSVLRNGTEAMFGIRRWGDLVGELGMFRDTRPSATVTACAPHTIRIYPHQVFEGFLEEHPDAWRAMLAVMGERQERADRQRAEFAGYEVEARVARILVDMAQRHGVPTDEGVHLGVRLSHTDLGKLVGARTDAVGNAIRRFRSEGILITSYRRVVIVDMERLNGVFDAAL
ncbi:Crp/Fnr family transcriptional regulator [Nocardiopsis sp. NPDC007018]|uniref:Crp/Fnr family transcriptional regulator n=1 Tax=Nocardiopsis sp. NPDC007018 TaxID=3155721 RepID=UPI0033E7D37D